MIFVLPQLWHFDLSLFRDSLNCLQLLQKYSVGFSALQHIASIIQSFQKNRAGRGQQAPVIVIQGFSSHFLFTARKSNHFARSVFQSLFGSGIFNCSCVAAQVRQFSKNLLACSIVIWLKVNVSTQAGFVDIVQC